MMSFPRRLSIETLDHLDENDPDAIHSRRDLRRINRLMGSASIFLRALKEVPSPPRRILEIGAGDGTLMLRLAQRLAADGHCAELTLLDRQQPIDFNTRRAFRDLGWRLETLQADVLAWAAEPESTHWDLCIANLFIHHFDAPCIQKLFAAVAGRCDALIACEPRRSAVALGASHLVGAIGANAVTREDAVLSVHAGFSASELSALWPADRTEWRLREGRAGFFSHRFVAVRNRRRNA